MEKETRCFKGGCLLSSVVIEYVENVGLDL